MLRSPLFKKKEVWGKIAADMNAMDESYRFTSGMCDKKFQNLMSTYREIHDRRAKTGQTGGKLWQYYELIDEIMGNRASVKAVSESSAAIEISSDWSSTDNYVEQSPDENAGCSSLYTTPVKPAKKKQHKESICDMARKWSEEFAEKQAAENRLWRVDMLKAVENQQKLEEQRLNVVSDLRNLMREWVEVIKKK